MYIYKKLSPKWKKFHEQKVFCFRFYILCENFSKIGPIIKKIPKFQSDPLNEICVLINQVNLDELLVLPMTAGQSHENLPTTAI